MREAIIGASMYLWLVNEQNHFLQTNLQKTPSEKNVPNCSSVNQNRAALHFFAEFMICVRSLCQTLLFSEV